MSATELTEGLASCQPARERWRRQQALDIAAILVISPLLLLLAAVIAAAVYLDSPGTVIFRVPRIGRDGRMFEMLKFRKMRQDAAGGPLTAAHDARYTPIGRFLANTRLDELPQVWNVLRGEMRLVGPRPEVAAFVSEFADHYAEITRVTPGMTGPAQLRFIHEKSLLECADPVATYRLEILPRKILVDLAYARSHTLGGDLRILGQTAALPALLVARWLRAQAATLRVWWPVGVAACVLVLLLVSSSGNID